MPQIDLQHRKLLIVGFLVLAAATGVLWRLSTGRTRVARDGSELVYVAEGSFTMGCDTGELDERPAHQVTLGAYWIGRYLVTNQQFVGFLNQRPFMRNIGVWRVRPSHMQDDIVLQQSLHPSDPRRFEVAAGRERYPVVGITWYGARAYCDWAGLRLPTEAEWERAARGSDERLYPWGSSWDTTRANCEATFHIGSRVPTSPVDAYPRGASPCGCFDMAGNVWEWCSSLYAYYPYRADDGREDLTADGPRVIRGGGWDSQRDFLRTTNRHRKHPNVFESRFRFPSNVGFRVAVSVNSERTTALAERVQDNPARTITRVSNTYIFRTQPAIQTQPSLDEKYRIHLGVNPMKVILGYPATQERASKYFTCKEHLVESLDPAYRDMVFQPDRLVRDRMGVRAGDVVADIGAGAGYFTYPLARAVGPQGAVWATDISVTALQYLQDRLRRAPLPNVHLVLTDVTDCLLPPSSIDIALVSFVHYFYYPRARPGISPPLSQVTAFYRSVWRALKPRGRLCIIENSPTFSLHIPERGDVSAKEIVNQMHQAGFKLMEQSEFNAKPYFPPGPYLFLFSKQ